MNNDALAGFLFAEMIREIDGYVKTHEFMDAIYNMIELGCDALPQSVEDDVIEAIERVFVKAVTKYNNKEGVW